MNAIRRSIACLLLVAFAVAAALPALAQQTTGTPGSPTATTTTGGKQLPLPDPKFGGVIKEKASESKPWWAPRIVPPKGAPNVLLIMTGWVTREFDDSDSPMLTIYYPYR